MDQMQNTLEFSHHKNHLNFHDKQGKMVYRGILLFPLVLKDFLYFHTHKSFLENFHPATLKMLFFFDLIFSVTNETHDHSYEMIENVQVVLGMLYDIN